MSGLGQSRRNTTAQGTQASFIAIAEALALVATQIVSAKDKDAQYRVTIFSDSKAAMSQVRKIVYDEQNMESRPGFEKVITRSKSLGYLGVHLELRCSPRRHGQGMQRAAAAAARKAAASLKYCKTGDSLDEGLQIVVDSLSCHDTEDQPSTSDDITLEPDLSWL